MLSKWGSPENAHLSRSLFFPFFSSFLFSRGSADDEDEEDEEDDDDGTDDETTDLAKIATLPMKCISYRVSVDEFV